VPISDWFRFRRDEASGATGPAARPSQPPTEAAPTQAVRLLLEATQLATAWRAGEQRLDVPALVPVARGERVVVRIASTMLGVDLDVPGEAVALSQAGGDRIADVKPDAEHVPVLLRLLAGLRGDEPMPCKRAPRYRVALPAVVSSQHGTVFMTAVTLSAGGCGLAWSGPAPRIGAGVHLRLGSGPRSASFRAMVRWARQDDKGLRVGVRFLSGEGPSLTQLLAEAQRAAQTA